MKILFLLLFLFFFTSVQADTVKVASFKGYQNVEFTEIVGNYVKFTHKNGVGRVEISEIPKDILAKLGNLEVKKEVIEPPLGEIECRVIQVIEGGIMVSTNSDKGFNLYGNIEKFPTDSACIVTTDTDSFYDGKQIVIKCYSIGNLTYENQNGKTLTIRQFTTNKELAIRWIKNQKETKERAEYFLNEAAKKGN